MRRRPLLLLAAGFSLVALVALLAWIGPALYRRWVTFPQRDAAWRSHRAQRVAVAEDGGWREFRGIIHAHSELSHDSRMTAPEVLRAAQAAGLAFVCFTDHARADGRAAFDLQWRGPRDSVLFVPGYELRDGLLAIGASAETVLNQRMPAGELARATTRRGGLALYSHPETPRDWSIPEIAGMEIYNLHTDFKRAEGGVGAYVRAHLPDLMLSFARYPDQIRYLPFQRPTEFLRIWDEQNRTRHVTGLAGNDSHQNVGLRAWITPAGQLRLDDTSPKPLREFPPDGLLGTLLRWTYGPLTPGRELFRLQLDPYAASAGFVNTHVLAHELTTATLLDSLRAGRVFIGFDVICDSSGFRWLADGPSGPVVMGETALLTPATRLRALSPVPCRFTLVREGEIIARHEGRTAEWTPTGAGKYRVEAELSVAGEWVPWVYANPIELRAAAAP